MTANETQRLGEDYALDIVPRNERTGRLSLMMAYWAIVGALVHIFLGALVALTVGTLYALLGALIVALFMGGINAYLSRHAARTGTTVSLFSQGMFGTVGSALTALLLGGTAIFYATFESAVIAVGFSSYVGGMPLEAWYAVAAAYGVLLSAGGIRKWFDRINGILLPFYWLGLFGAFAWAISEYGFNTNWLTYQPDTITFAGPPLLFAVVTYLGAFVLVMFAWDYARFARESDSRFHGVVTFGPVFCTVAFVINAFVGIFLVLTVPTSGALSEESVLLALISLMGVWGLLFIAVSQTRINTANYYVASLNIENFFARLLGLRLPRFVWLVLVGIICFLFMLVDVIAVLNMALQYQAIFIVSWVAVATAHVFAAPRHRRLFQGTTDVSTARVKRFDWGGMAAWFVSSGLGVLLLEVVGGSWAAWSSPITFVLAFVGYAVWIRSSWASSIVQHVPKDDTASEDQPTVEAGDPTTSKPL